MKNNILTNNSLISSFSISIIIVLLMFNTIAYAQENDGSMLSLERIFTDREFSTKRFGPTRWLGEGDAYTTLERSGEVRGRDIVRYDCETGERVVIVPAYRLIPPGESDPLSVQNYFWSNNGEKLLIFTNTQKVWRRNTRGDYWIVDLTSWKMHKLGGEANPSTLMFATFSPNGKNVAYVRENNLYVESLENHSIKPLTTSGSKTIINGTFDWAYEEEFDLRNGFRWSPDGKKIAYWQLDAEGVGVFNMVNNIDSIYSRIIPVQYPKVGTTNSSCRIGVVDIEEGETTWFQVPGDPRNNYIARMEWAASSEEIILQQLNRRQNTNRVFMGNAATGEVRNIFIDRDDTWVEVVDDWKWLNEGKEFTWVSERDGWKHAYRIKRSGEKIKLITLGEFDVISIVGIDDEKSWLYYIASPEKPTQRYLYRIRMNGEGEPQRLTPGGKIGTNSYDISPNFKWTFHTFSSVSNPPVIELIKLPEHRTVRIMEDNRQVKENLSVIKRKPTEFFRIDIGDGVILDGYKILPYNFDPFKKYPVLFYVYGEPHGQTVRDSWGGTYYMWHTLLAQQGYIVISVDNRGTSAPRGREWRKSIYRQIGILASSDQAAAARIIRRWEYVDSNRIAIWGWSGGGSMSLNALFRYPDLYQTAMAIAFISNQRLYDTIYQERFMDLPGNNPEGYKNGSPITFAHQLKGNLLMIHGTGDDNCHYQSAEMLFDELIKHNKMFTAVPYPSRTHSIREGENSYRHVFETLTWYLKNHVPAGPINR
ncbi:S9 family peptidase [Bacteroidota bacterium]